MALKYTDLAVLPSDATASRDLKTYEKLQAMLLEIYRQLPVAGIGIIDASGQCPISVIGFTDQDVVLYQFFEPGDLVGVPAIVRDNGMFTVVSSVADEGRTFAWIVMKQTSKTFPYELFNQ